MPYRQIGLAAVMDLSNFTTNALKYSQTIANMNRETANASIVGKTLSPILNTLGQAFSTVAAVAIGIISSQVFKSIINELGQMGSQAITAASEFQLLTIRLDTLVARNYAEEFGTTIPEAMKETSGQAQALLEWVRKLAIQTPFNVTTLADTIAYGQAFGFTTDQTVRLTNALINFSAGMGLSDEVLHRIIWNFGQMQSAGRVLGRELRDLGNSMVPITTIVQTLADEYGVTTEEMKKMLQEGTVSSEKFIETFIKMAETDFPNAARRMAQTWLGITNNIKDFIDASLGMDIVKPALDEVSKSLDTFVQGLLTSKTAREITVGLGISLRMTYLSIADTITTILVPALNSLTYTLFGNIDPLEVIATAVLTAGAAFREFAILSVNAMGFVLDQIGRFIEGVGIPMGTLSEMSTNWGTNFILNFAKGIAGAIGFVFDALSVIALAITDLLQAESPPKLLPDLEIWGMEGMNSYLEGWKNADYGIFDDIAGILTNYIKAFGTTIPESDMISKIIGSREDIEKIVEDFRKTGKISQDVIARLSQDSGIGENILGKYIRSLAGVRDAEQESVDVNKLLGFQMGDTIKVAGVVVDSFQDLYAATLMMSGAAGEALRKYALSMINVETAQKALTAAQENLSNVTKHYDDILAGLNAQQNKLNDDMEDSGRLKEIDKALSTVILTADERNRLEMEKRGILLKRAIRDTELEKATAVDAAKAKVDAANEELKKAQEIANAQKRMAQDVSDSQLKNIQEQASAWEKYIKMVIDKQNLLNQREAALEKERRERERREKEEQEAKPPGEGGPGYEFPGMPIPLPEFDIEKMKSDLQARLDEINKAITEKMKTLGDEIATIFKPTEKPIGDFVTNMTNLGLALTPIFDKLKTDTFTYWNETILPWWTDTAFPWLRDDFYPFMRDKMFPFLKTEAIPIIAGVFTALVLFKTLAWLPLLITAISNPISLLVVLIALLVTVIVGQGPQALDTLKNIFGLFLIVIGLSVKGCKLAWTDLMTWLSSEALTNIGKWLTDLFNSISKKITDWQNDFDPYWFVKWWEDVWKKVTDWLATAITDIGNWASDVVNVVIGLGGLGDLYPRLDEWLDGLFSSDHGKIAGWLGSTIIMFKERAADMVAGLITGLLESGSELEKSVRNLIRRALGMAEEQSDTHSESKAFYSLGENWMRGLASGISDNANLVEKALSSSLSSLVAPTAKSSLSAFSSPTVNGAGSYSNVVNNNRNINISVTPTYTGVSSPATIYHDVSAAIASIRM